MGIYNKSHDIEMLLNRLLQAFYIHTSDLSTLSQEVKVVLNNGLTSKYGDKTTFTVLAVRSPEEAKNISDIFCDIFHTKKVISRTW